MFSDYNTVTLVAARMQAPVNKWLTILVQAKDLTIIFGTDNVQALLD